LKFRLGCTSALQHLGGIHSGCALSGCTWLIFKLVTIFIDHQNNHDAVLVMGVITNMLVCISIASAFPWVRNTHHKSVDRGPSEQQMLMLLAAYSKGTTASSDGDSTSRLCRASLTFLS
jgi:hypothetical protein